MERHIQQNVCDTCHSTANHHQSDGAAPGGQDHQNSVQTAEPVMLISDGFSADVALVQLYQHHMTQIADCTYLSYWD